MQFAKSIYLSDIIYADKADYDDYKILGLTCPFCREPVFLRAGHDKIRGDKLIEIDPVFCHYPDSKKASICENRSYSKAGKALIEKLEIEARGQRERFFRNHLWSVFKSCYPGTKLIQEVGSEKKKSILLARDFQKDFSVASKENQKYFTEDSLFRIVEKMMENNPEIVKNNLEWFDIYQYKQVCIINEILLFLYSRKGCLVLGKMFSYISHAIMTKAASDSGLGLNQLDMEKFGIPIHAIFNILYHHLFFIDWQSTCARKSNQGILFSSILEEIKQDPFFIINNYVEE